MLVALTILAVAATTLFGWVLQISGQIQRLNNQQAQAMAQLSALRYLKLVNPAQTPKGQREFTDFVLSWNATAITPMLPTLNPSDAPLSTRIGVYAVRATLTRGSSVEPWVAFDTQLAGWTQPVAGATGAAGVDGGLLPGISGRQ